MNEDAKTPLPDGASTPQGPGGRSVKKSTKSRPASRGKKTKPAKKKSAVQQKKEAKKPSKAKKHRSAGRRRSAKEANMPETVRVRLFQDDEGEVPLAHHTLTVVSPDGSTSHMTTDEQGYCEVPDGSEISADEESGLAIDPLMVYSQNAE